MADVSHRTGDIASHPDVSEMRDRFTRMVNGKDVVLVDGPVLLAGLYCAVSPWVVHFSGARPDLAMNNLVLGIAIALLGLGLTMAPDRMYGLCHALSAIGVWMIVSPWVATRHPDAGMIWNNIVIGAITVALGLVAAGMAAQGRRAITGGGRRAGRTGRPTV
ncbi:SPW repeat protein [Streptomyces sp. URMC 123]|uniref:SPW repeat protein n=1 Tax=Streptomyces sp. URMC 123 TaxID=3423403 RepID=UPI003F1E1CE0